MEEPIFGSDTGSVVKETLQKVPEALLLVTTSEEVLKGAIEHLSQGDGEKSVSILSNKRVIKEVTGDFIVGSLAADLVESEQLTLQFSTDLKEDGTVFVNEDLVVSLVDGGERTAALVSRNETFTSATTEKYTTVQEQATEFSLRTPPLSQVRETLRETFNDTVAADFDTCLDSQDEIRGGEEDLDEVGIALIVAAKHELQLYDISKWGEDNGFASKATFSRVKNALEDVGAIKTEKIPMDIGRPRLRLLLADEKLRNATTEDMVTVGENLLKEDAEKTSTVA